MSQKSRVFDFNDPDARRDLALIFAEINHADDLVVLLIRGSIILDNLLLRLLDGYLHFDNTAYSFSKKYRLGFEGKCQLGKVVGLLSGSERDALLEFNEVRNKVAHRMDFRVESADVEELVKALERYGYSPVTEVGGDSTVSTIEMLRAIIASLVGLFLERIAETDAAGRLAILGKELDKSRWERLRVFGAIASMITVALERVIAARNDAVKDSMERLKKTLEADESLATLSVEELNTEINRRFAAELTPDLSDAISAAESELQTLGDKLGRKYKWTLGYDHGPIKITFAEQVKAPKPSRSTKRAGGGRGSTKRPEASDAAS